MKEIWLIDKRKKFLISCSCVESHELIIIDPMEFAFMTIFQFSFSCSDNIDKDISIMIGSETRCCEDAFEFIFSCYESAFFFEFPHTAVIGWLPCFELSSESISFAFVYIICFFVSQHHERLLRFLVMDIDQGSEFHDWELDEVSPESIRDKNLVLCCFYSYLTHQIQVKIELSNQNIGGCQEKYCFGKKCLYSLQWN